MPKVVISKDDKEDKEELSITKDLRLEMIFLQHFTQSWNTWSTKRPHDFSASTFIGNNQHFSFTTITTSTTSETIFTVSTTITATTTSIASTLQQHQLLNNPEYDIIMIMDLVMIKANTGKLL